MQAVVDAALDPEPTERELAAIDPALPYEERLIEAVTIMQRRAHRIWPLMASVGKSHAHGTAPADFAALRQIVAAGHARLRTDPATAARQLRAVTLAVSNPLLFSGDPMTAREIVTVFLHGILADRRTDGGDNRSDPPPPQLTPRLRALNSSGLRAAGHPGFGIAAPAFDEREHPDG